MKYYTKAKAVKEINGVSAVKHIKASRKTFERVIEPLDFDGVYLDELYLKSVKKVFRNKQTNEVYFLGFGLAWVLEPSNKNLCAASIDFNDCTRFHALTCEGCINKLK